MPVDVWENLVGSVVEGRYRLRALTASGRDQAEFVAEETQGSIEPITVTLIAAPPDEMDAIRSQLLMASHLQHPNLAHILGAGESAVEGQFMLYLASETPDQTLAAALETGPMPKDAARALASDVLGALSFLHEQGLVYRSLDPQTIVRAGDRWKLADFGQVCPLGGPNPEPPGYTSPYLPPEAKTGPVLAAWDMWGFGVLMREALTGQTMRAGRLPRPFDGIVDACLQPVPERRPSSKEIRESLKPGSPAAAVLAEPAAIELPPRSDTPPIVSSRTTRYHRPAGDLWRSLRILALTALACLVILLPFSLRKKKPAPSEIPAVTTAPPAPVRHAAREQAPPAESARGSRSAPSSMPAPKPVIVKAGYISSRMNGHRTASGERFNGNTLTAATRVYAMGTRVRVTNLGNGKSVVVRVNDRGGRGHLIGLTERAARELGLARSGTAQVMLEVVR